MRIEFLDAITDWESVDNNKYLNDLPNVVARFGLHGRYIDFRSATDPANNGVYFVCGYKRDVEDELLDTDMEFCYQDQNECNEFLLNLHITKLTGQSPYNCHADIMRFCLHASTMTGLFRKYCVQVKPIRMSISFVQLSEMLYLNATDTRLSQDKRLQFRNTLDEFLETEGEKEFYSQGKSNDDKEMHVKPEHITKQSPKNMVPMWKLKWRAKKIEQIVLTAPQSKLFVEQLRQHPHILYFQAKPVIQKLEMDDNEGFGSAEANTISSVVFKYDAKYRKEIDIMYLKAVYPAYFEYTPEEIASCGDGAASFALSLKELEHIMQAAKEKAIPLCIDESRPYFSPEVNHNSDVNVAGYHILMPNDEIKLLEMEALLGYIATINQQKHILEDEDIELCLLRHRDDE